MAAVQASAAAAQAALSSSIQVLTHERDSAHAQLDTSRHEVRCDLLPMLCLHCS